MSTRGDGRLALCLLTPGLVVLAAVSVYPLISVFWLSLQRRVPVFRIAEFIGPANYLFLLRDPGFWNAAGVTALFTALSVAGEVLLGLGLALALWRQQRWRRTAFGLLLLPWCLPGVVTARMFEWIYHPTAGLANLVLGGRSIDWLGDPALALPAVVAADVWRTTPFVALLAYARLVSLPPELYEAVAVDGAGPIAAFRAITLPLLAPVLLIATLFRTLDALRAFDLMFVLTGGGPGGRTETLPIYAYRNLFETLQLGFGAAVAGVLFIVVLVVAWAYLRGLERAEAQA
jgi:trehalose/maltose transport system permease protein